MSFKLLGLIFLILFIWRFLTQTQAGNFVPPRQISQFRTSLEQVFDRVLPEPQASLISGIVLGKQRRFNYDFYQALSQSGTAHIIVASGMNITLLAGPLLEFLARFFQRRLAIIISLIIMIFYSLLAGFNPPIVRAAIMVGVAYFGQFFGRKTQGFWLLVLAGAVMLLINPHIFKDLGFQLSFCATAGLITLAPKLEKILPTRINKELAQTISCQIYTLPILMVSFGHFNPLSILPNLLIVWLVPYLMYLGLMIAFGDLLFLPLGLFFGWLIWLPLTYLVKVIMFFGRLKFLQLRLTHLSWFFVLGYYLVLTSLLMKKKTINPVFKPNRFLLT